MRFPRLPVAFLALGPCLAFGQVTVVDDGSFTISRAGVRVGREDFSIRHVPTTQGAYETLTRGVVVLGTHRVTLDFSADSLGRPVRIQSRTMEDGRTGESYRAEVSGQRYSARARRDASESLRELMLPPGALVVEDGILHPLQFVVARGPGTVPGVVPARGVLVTLTVEDGGADRVSIALASIEARRFIVREGSGSLVREVWVDRQGRVLKVAIPSQQLVAVRDEPPRSPAR
jgi:hypothetical protein